MLLATPNMEQRTQGIGILDRQIARDYSPVGPLIRGSGFARDLRFDHPYADYGNIPKTLLPLPGGRIPGVAVKCVEIWRNTGGEGGPLDED